MIAVFFRVMNPRGKPSGYVGFAAAKDKQSLLWVIDEFCDPYNVEIQTAHKFGMCVQHEDIENKGFQLDKLETSEELPNPHEGKWRKPKWKSSNVP